MHVGCNHSRRAAPTISWCPRRPRSQHQEDDVQPAKLDVAEYSESTEVELKKIADYRDSSVNILVNMASADWLAKKGVLRLG